MSVVESAIGREGGGSSNKREYYAFGYATESEAVTAVHAATSICPTFINNLPRDDNATQAEEIAVTNDATSSDWRVIVRWNLLGGTPQTGLNYSFSIGGGSFHRNYAIAQIENGEDAPEVNGAINYDGEEVHGVTIPAQPSMEFTIERKKTAAQVTNAYLSTVSDLIYTVNDATFEDWAAGEVLFMGLTGSRTGDDEFTLNYKFGRNQNRTGQTIAGISGVAYNGWNYVWVRWAEKEANNAKGVEAKGVYVAKVHEDGDFSGLDL